MMQLPASKRSKSSESHHQRHADKMKKMISAKQSGVVAQSVTSLTLAQSSLAGRIKKTLKSSASLKPHRGGNTSIKEIKKRYGFTWKRTLKLAGVFGVIIMIGLVILTGVGFAFAIDAYQKAPVINPSTLQANESSIVYLNDGKTELFRLFGKQNRKNVTLDQVPVQMQYAIIGLEEKDFYKQDLPWLSLLRSVQDCVLSKVGGEGSSCAGGSGLAQQLYRNVTGDNLQNIQRKIRELFAAKKLLDNNSKDDILELYMNWVPFGKNIAGVQVAAETYFGKDITDVTLPQACIIASMPQNPSTFENAIYARELPESPNYVFWKRLESRKNICLNNIASYDIKGDGKRLIEKNDQLEALKKEDLAFIPRKDNRKYPHFQDYVERELLKIFPDQTQLQEGGFKIVTTLDAAVQDKLDSIYDSEENREQLALGPVNNAAGVILEGVTGRIIAMRGSMDYNNKEIGGENNIVDQGINGYGQAPGSTMKPYDYATVLNAGFNPSTTIIDYETDFGGGYKPRNFGFTQNGLVTLAYALQNSLNTPAVKTAFLSQGSGDGPDGTTGMANIVDFAGKMGLKFPALSTDCKQYITTTLGACDINLLSHATAFNTFAQDGSIRTATPFISITVDQNKVRSKEESDAINAQVITRLDELYLKKDAVINPAIARQMNSILSDTGLRNFGPLARYLTLPGWDGHVAAKTGTATVENNEISDMWTAGYTKKYTVLSWAGNTDNAPVDGNVLGLLVTSPVWQRIMAFLHEGLDPAAPELTFSTEGLVKTAVACPEGVKGSRRCGGELLTVEQADILKNAQANISKPDYNPYEKTIFENRNEVFTAKKYISKLDRKLVDKDKYPPEYVEEVNCLIAPSAFPKSPNWRAPANRYAENQTNKCNERSTVDPNAIGVDLTVNPGLASGQTLNTPFTITAKGRVEGQGVKRIEFKVDGALIDAADSASLTINPQAFNIPGNASDPHTVLINVVDAFDKAYEFTYAGVKFVPAPEFDNTKYGSVSPNCSLTGAGLYLCTFTLPNGVGWNQPNGALRVTIGSDTTGAPCNYNGPIKQFTCADVPRGPTPAINPPIKLKSPGDGGFISTGGNVLP